MRKSVLEAMRVFMLDLTEAINIRDGVARPFYTFLIDPVCAFLLLFPFIIFLF